jgi:hypothetical protein
MKISRDEMKRREDIARTYFRKNPEATVQELNEHFAARGEKRMGARAYTIRVEVRKEAKRGGVAAKATGSVATGTFPRINAPSPTLTPPAQEADAKLAQEVMGILNDLAKRVAGSRIQSIFLNVSGAVPTVKLMELEPREREVRLGEAPRAVAPAPQAAPQPAPAAQPSNVTTLAPANGGSTQPPAGQ